MDSISASTKIDFNIAQLNMCTEAEGPYKRLAIWFQGCDLACKGCCNSDYRPLVPRNLISLDKLIGVISNAGDKYGIEGVTYLGGEPTIQKGLPYLTEAVRTLGLGIISFTGHKFEEVAESLSGCDLVIDGEYVESLRDNQRRIIGSKNQRMIYLTDRYRASDSWWFGNSGKTVEINVMGDEIIANGDMWTD